MRQLLDVLQRALYFGSTRLMSAFIARCEELDLPEMAKNMRAYSARSPELNKKRR